MRQVILSTDGVDDALNSLARSVRNDTLEAAAKVAQCYGAPEEACRRILMLRTKAPPAGTEG